MHPLGQQVAPHRGVRGHARVARLAGNAQIVQLQLRRPARMLAVLAGQRGNGLSAQAGEATRVAAQAVFERGHRVRRAPGRVVPALQRRGTEAHVQARDGVAPGLGGQRDERAIQLPGLGRCGHQRTDD